MSLVAKTLFYHAFRVKREKSLMLSVTIYEVHLEVAVAWKGGGMKHTAFISTA